MARGDRYLMSVNIADGGLTSSGAETFVQWQEVIN